jgi:hypothetical protein
MARVETWSIRRRFSSALPVSADRRSYAFSFQPDLAILYLVKGVKKTQSRLCTPSENLQHWPANV